MNIVGGGSVKFCYRDHVEIIGGFYKGQVGIIVDITDETFPLRLRHEYLVYIREHTKWTWVKEKQIKRVIV